MSNYSQEGTWGQLSLIRLQLILTAGGFVSATKLFPPLRCRVSTNKPLELLLLDKGGGESWLGLSVKRSVTLIWNYQELNLTARGWAGWEEVLECVRWAGDTLCELPEALQCEGNCPDTAPLSPALFLPGHPQSVLCSARVDCILHLFPLRPLQKCHIYLLENL